MEGIKAYITRLISRIYVDSVAAFWEQPTPRKKFKQELNSVLAGVKKMAMKMAEKDERIDFMD